MSGLPQSGETYNKCKEYTSDGLTRLRLTPLQQKSYQYVLLFDNIVEKIKLLAGQRLTNGNHFLFFTFHVTKASAVTTRQIACMSSIVRPSQIIFFLYAVVYSSSQHPELTYQSLGLEHPPG